MDIIYRSRSFNASELKLLHSLKSRKEKERDRKTKFYFLIVAALIGAASAYITTVIPDSFWTFLFGTLAVFAFAVVVFTPYELYKMQKQSRRFLRQLNETIDKGTVDTFLVSATRIAVAREYEDEGDLFIIECGTTKILYLWDTQYNFSKKFPCLDFEVYADDFSNLSDIQICPLSSKIKPVTINKLAKWNYMRKFGGPGHLETDNANFDALIQEYNSCS